MRRVTEAHHETTNKKNIKNNKGNNDKVFLKKSVTLMS
jgi:hypothetical protein